jgi:membrane protein YdbS with pleckstrin-like domain
MYACLSVCPACLSVCLSVCLCIYLLVALYKLLKGLQLNWLLVSMIKIVARIRVLHIVIYIKLKYNHVSQEGNIDVQKTGLS